MLQVRTCLWFESEAEAAAGLYVSLLPQSRIEQVRRAPGGAAASVMVVEFTLAGQGYQALNGGVRAEYGHAASIAVSCDGQDEVDRLWAVLTGDGGVALQCGWLRDRFGVPWQIVPSALPRLLAHPDPAAAARVFQAMQRMVKLDIAELERAATEPETPRTDPRQPK